MSFILFSLRFFFQVRDDAAHDAALRQQRHLLGRLVAIRRQPVADYPQNAGGRKGVAVLKFLVADVQGLWPLLPALFLDQQEKLLQEGLVAVLPQEDAAEVPTTSTDAVPL